jgi:glutamyl-tRNA reductase
MKFFVAGLSYKTAAVEVREKVAVAPARAHCTGCRLKIAGGLREVVLLSTCNRVEIYAVTDSPWANGAELFRLLTKDGSDVSGHLYVKEDVAAMEHLFAVASGLDSMVLGETEITGQLKQAYQAAQAAKLTGPVTNRLFQTALQVGKEVRTQTAIGRGATSVGSVAVELAERIFDNDFSHRTVMIVGAGKMGEACVRHLAKKGARSVLVVNRSLDKARALATEISGIPLPFEQLFHAMEQADVVVSSTGARRAILDREAVARVMRARAGRPLFLVDIAVPRDIEASVQTLEGVYLYNIDHLQGIVRQNAQLRAHELGRCQAIIAQRAAEAARRLAPRTMPAPRPETALAPSLELAAMAV